MAGSMNPAQELFEIIEGWVADQDNPASSVRRLDETDGLSEHLRAVRCIEDVNLILNQAEAHGHRVTRYRQALHQAAMTVFHYPRGWRNDSSSITNTAISLLEVLPGQLSSWMGSMTINPQVLVNERGTIISKLEMFHTALSEDASLDPSFVRYARRLTNHIRTLLDDVQHGGAFRINEAIDELMVYLNSAVKLSDNPDQRSKMAEVRDFFTGLGGQVVAGVLTSGVSDLVLPMIAGA